MRSGCSCAGPFAVKLLGIDTRLSKDLLKSILSGFEDLKPGWIRLDTFFTFEKYELDYIINALRLISYNGEKIMRYY